MTQDFVFRFSARRCVMILSCEILENSWKNFLENFWKILVAENSWKILRWKKSWKILRLWKILEKSWKIIYLKSIARIRNPRIFPNKLNLLFLRPSQLSEKLKLSRRVRKIFGKFYPKEKPGH